ncbi:MAG TPA: hypothetical protein VFY21_06790 [Xanthobacteraceae bacterium]|nr:hypothetical protein [Xanthobacteraceae bacterium]
MVAKTKQEERAQQEDAGIAVPRGRASADYEEPRRNVADMPDPVTLPPNKARASIPVKGMWLVLTIGIALTIIGYLVGYYIFYT